MGQNRILVTRPVMPTLKEYVDEIKELWDTRWLTNMGTKFKQLKGVLEEYLLVDNVEPVVNGHLALEIAIQAMDMEPGEIITTPFTFASTTFAIVRSGFVPVFCDINLDDFTMDASKIEGLITKKTRAILPVHVYGNVCNVDAIQKIADKYRLKVIYDAAHAFGVKFRDKGIASFGDASCFSFHATKVFHTIEGGAICFGKACDEYGRRIRQLENFGYDMNDDIKCIGGNAKMNEFAAAMGICNLRHIEECIAKREAIYKLYMSKLNPIEGIELPKPQQDIKGNYAYYPILVDSERFGESRDSLIERLNQADIYPRKYFSPCTNTFQYYGINCNLGDTPLARMVSERVLTLPIYPELSEEAVEKICNEIRRKK